MCNVVAAAVHSLAGEIDMAAPEQLAAFLQRSYTRFPASADRRHMLVLWDHGNGWKGYGVDNMCVSGTPYNPNGCDQFTMQTLVTGLKNGLAGKKLDVIGFDACLMSMYEVSVLGSSLHAR